MEKISIDQNDLLTRGANQGRGNQVIAGLLDKVLPNI